MDSTVMPKPTEADNVIAAANDVLAARADERLAHAYEQIARADEQLARLTEQLAKMEQDAAQHPSHHPLAVPLRRPSRGRPALRGLVGLLAAACIVGTALVLQSSYGEAARPVIAQWTAPYIHSVSWLAPATPERPAQPVPSGVNVVSAEAASAQSTPSVQAAVLAAPELTQLLRTMARDLTTVQQGIEELKANQERMAGDNAKTVEQVKASQEQVTRLVAKVSEQDQRARTAAPTPQPVANPSRKPAPAQASSQVRAQPLQLQPAAR